jgi:hypothetical protein
MSEIENSTIAKRILVGCESFRALSTDFGIVPAAIRSRMHTYCRNKNRDLYDSLRHSNTYADGWTNDHCLPLLRVLRENSDAFFKPEVSTQKAIQAILSKLTMNQPELVYIGKGYKLSDLQNDLEAIGEGNV